MEPKPQIVVLDGFTLNPGDLSWQRLQQLGNCAIHDRTAADAVLARSSGADVVLTNKTLLSADIINALPRLRYIGVLATGHNVVDIAAAAARNVVVTNVPNYCAPAVAQLVFAQLLEFTRHVAHHAAEVRAGRWANADDWCFWDRPQLDLEGMTMGLVGFGSIGQATAKIADAFGMRVLVSTRSLTELPAYVTLVDVDELFREADVVSLHCPLTPQTHQLVDRRRLAMMKSTAYLINTSRGPLVDESALADALNAGSIAGAGLDVLEQEPPAVGSPLIGAKNCTVTPHIAWATSTSRQRLLDTAVDNVASFLGGNPTNVVHS